MRNQLLILAVGATLAALLAAGCGDSSEAAITKQAFVKQADEICETQKSEIKARARTQESNNIKRTLRETTAALGVEADEIEAIEIPSGEDKKVEGMLGNVRRALDFAEAKPVNVPKANEYLFRAEEEANDYGLKQCFLA